MIKLDNYIYDSQFSFLADQEKLKKRYFDSVLVKARHTEIAGLNAFVRNEEWDSKRTGKSITRLLWLEDKVDERNYEGILKNLRQTDCCYIRLNGEHTFCRVNHEITNPLLATKVSQHADLSDMSLAYDASLKYIRYSEQIDDHEETLKQILDLASVSFTNNRFSADPHFSASFVNDMYYSWLINEVNDAGSKLYFIRDSREVAAFLLYKKDISPFSDHTIGFISLIAASEKYRGKSYGSNLLQYVLAYEKEKGTKHCIANTSNKSTDALGFFSKNSFKVTSYINEYHLWN